MQIIFKALGGKACSIEIEETITINWTLDKLRSERARARGRARARPSSEQ